MNSGSPESVLATIRTSPRISSGNQEGAPSVLICASSLVIANALLSTARLWARDEAVVTARRAGQGQGAARAGGAEPQEDQRRAGHDGDDAPGGPAGCGRRRAADRRRSSGRGSGRGSRRRGAQALVTALVEPEGRVLVGHQRDVAGHAQHPPVEAEHQVEDRTRVAAGEEQHHGGDQDQDADETDADPARRRRRVRRTPVPRRTARRSRSGGWRAATTSPAPVRARAARGSRPRGARGSPARRRG